jgi:hypothetical protein
VRQVCISRWDYAIVRPESLRVGGQGPDFVLVCMKHINKIVNTARCRPTTMNELRGTELPQRRQGIRGWKVGKGAKCLA